MDAYVCVKKKKKKFFIWASRDLRVKCFPHSYSDIRSSDTLFFFIFTVNNYNQHNRDAKHIQK